MVGYVMNELRRGYCMMNTNIIFIGPSMSSVVLINGGVGQIMTRMGNTNLQNSRVRGYSGIANISNMNVNGFLVGDASKVIVSSRT